MDDGSRAVATTASVARAASMIRAPNPRDAPVMNQVFMCLFLRSTEIQGRRTIECWTVMAFGTISGSISHRAVVRCEATWIVSRTGPGLGAVAATVAAMWSRRRRVVASMRPLADRRESLMGIDD